MIDLHLNDILHLTNEEISNSKIALNMSYAGKPHRDRWFENHDVSYSYYSYQGNKRNFKVGQLVFGFVQLEQNNRFLFVTAGKITEVPFNDTCKYEPLTKYDGLIGRLIVEINKGNTYSRYVFKLSKYINEAKVIEVLPKEYEQLSFKGYDEVFLTFNQLKLIIDSNKFVDYRTALQAVKGVYVLTDTSNGKLYIGSAYGVDGIAQRWTSYINTKTGGNKELIRLYNEKGDSYFMNNFTFGLLEYFGSNTDNNKIINREAHWKKILGTNKNGYNDN